MSSFKKNRSVIEITKTGDNIINEAEDTNHGIISKHSNIVKEITIPFSAEMSKLLEEMFERFEGNISRRKICAKYLLKALRLEKEQS